MEYVEVGTIRRKVPIYPFRVKFLQNETAGTNSILDLGCDHQVWRRYMRSREYIGADIVIDREQGKKPDVQCTAYSLPFREGVFDAIYLGGILNQVHLRKTILECSRVLRPKGKLLVEDHNFYVCLYLRRKHPSHITILNVLSLTSTLKSIGLSPRFFTKDTLTAKGMRRIIATALYPFLVFFGPVIEMRAIKTSHS